MLTRSVAESNGPRPSKRAWLLLLLAVTIGLAVRKVGWADIRATLRSANATGLVLAVGCHALSNLSKSLRLWILSKPFKAGTARQVLPVGLIGLAAAAVLIANLGEVARVTLLTRVTGIKSSLAASLAVADRLADLVGFFCLCLVAALAGATAVSGAWRLLAPVMLVACGAALILMARRVVQGSARLQASRAGAITVWFHELASSFSAHSQPKQIVLAGSLTTASWGLQLLTYHLAAIASGLHIPVTASLLALVAANMAGTIRVTPGNVGVFQIAYSTAVHPFGVGLAPAVAVGLLIQSAQLLTTLALGLGSVPFVSATALKAWHPSQSE